MRYLIAAELQTLGKNYEGFTEEIKSLGNGAWWHYLNSVWMVDSDFGIQMIDIRLRAHLGQNDRLLISPIAGPYLGILLPEAWTWLNR